MKKVLLRLRSYYEHEATDTEKPVLRFILQHPREASVMDIRTLASKGSCSAATLLRICQKNGFNGYRELKDSLLQEIGFRQTAVRSLETSPQHSKAYHLLNLHVHALEQTYELLDMDVLDQAVDAISKAHLIHLYGLGASYLAMEDLQMKLIRISRPCQLLHDLHLQMVDASNAGTSDVAIIASYSGQTAEINAIAQRLKERGCPIIALSQYAHTELFQLADYKLFVPAIEKELRTAAISSRTCTLYLVDILYQRLLEMDYEQDMDRIIETSELLMKKSQNPLETSSPSDQPHSKS